jgi:hypothetical protein
MNRRDESGAIAVLVALLAVALIGMSAFVADFGVAYANKRQLQTAADASALGAAGVFANQQYRQCADMRSNGLGAAQTEAQAKVDANKTSLSTSSLTQFEAACEDGDLVVRTTVSASSPNIFGKVLGRDGDYQVFRSAAAVVEAGVTGPRLRPLALCAADLPDDAIPGTVFRLYAPGDGLATPTTCPVPPNPGNWWTLDCPMEGADDGHGNSALEDQIRNGCSSPIEIVRDQEGLNGVALNLHLATRCPGPSTSAPFQCLSGDPGQPDAGQVETAWEDLINSGITVPIPVFCSPSPGRCATTSVIGTGTNAIFPVHKLISVKVCGYHFGSQPSRRYIGNSVGHCSGYASDMTNLMADGSDDVYLLMVAQNLQVSNVTADSECDLGDDDCDGGLRQVRMVGGGFAY